MCLWIIQKMGAKGSKPSTPMGRVPTVPKNTPLAYILDNWRYFPGTLGKDKQKMIEYCTKIWGGKKISKKSLLAGLWVRRGLGKATIKPLG